VNWEDVITEAAATDTGMRRANNQDSLAIVRATTPDLFKSCGHLFMVADGMGAHAAGELASKLACDNVPHTYRKKKNLPPGDALSNAFLDVGGEIFRKAASSPEFHRMGTTCTALVLHPSGAIVAHVGDSRVYRIRGGRIDQLSFDHSLVWELVRKGHMKLEQVEKAYPRNVITRCLGPELQVEVDVEGPLPIEKGDVYLLCSDGLSGPVSDAEIGVFASSFHPANACRYLMHLANLRSGSDNVTIVIARVGEWVEPGAGGSDETAGARKSKGKFLGGLFNNFKGRKPSNADEFEPHATAECTLDRQLIGRIIELVNQIQTLAKEQGWDVDWANVAAWRAQGEERFKAGQLREALGAFSEAVSLLGEAGRLYRNAQLEAGRE